MDGSSISLFVSSVALIIQGFLVYYAYKAIKQAEDTAKKRAIVDLIIKQREDSELRRIFQELYKLRDTNKKVSEFVKDAEKLRETIYALDTIEFTAVGIRLSAFDENVYKELQCTKVIRTWDSVSGFVMELREEKHSPTLYQDLERLAERWKANPIIELKKQAYSHY